jgi:hypothetical protein
VTPEQDPFTVLALDALDGVTGGRYTRGTPPADPKLLQGIAELAKAVQTVGQNLAAVKQQSSQDAMQLVQQVMQKKRG